MTSALRYLELTKLSRRLHAREISPVEATTPELTHIERLDGQLKRYAHVMAEAALVQARAAYWVGEFSGTFFNDKGENSLFHRDGVKCPSWFDSDLNNKKSKAGGYCIITDLNGDQAYLTWQGAGTPGAGGRTQGTFQYTGGTGKYQGISGDNAFVGVTQVNWKDGRSSGYRPGTGNCTINCRLIGCCAVLLIGRLGL
jgi:hypothetical protein